MHFELKMFSFFLIALKVLKERVYFLAGTFTSRTGPGAADDSDSEFASFTSSVALPMGLSGE